MFELNRRTLLGAAGVTGFAAMLPAGLAVAAEKLEGVAGPGSLLAWLRVSPDGAIRVSVAKLELPDSVEKRWRPVGSAQDLAISPPRSSAAHAVSLHIWQTREAAVAVTRTMLVAIAGANWTVPAKDCKAANGCIIHEASGRQVGYRIWTEIA